MADEVDLSALCDDPHVVAVLLKQFLGSMHTPVVPIELYDPVMNAYSTLHTAFDGLVASQLAHAFSHALARRISLPFTQILQPTRPKSRAN